MSYLEAALAVLAAIGWTGFLLTLWQTRTPRARHRPARTAERRARKEIEAAEARRVKEIADHLAAEARRSGQKFSRSELEQEARRLLMQAGATGGG